MVSIVRLVRPRLATIRGRAIALVTAGALISIATIGSSPAAAAGTVSGYYLLSGPADAVGCHGLQVWKDTVQLKTIPADDGDVYGDGSVYECATNRASATLINGNFVFDWVRNVLDLTVPSEIVDYWVSDGTPGGTQKVKSWGGERCDSGWDAVQIVAYIWTECAGQDLSIFATHGTVASTLRLPVTNPAAGTLADGSDFAPLYVIVGGNVPLRIVFVANTRHDGRELWVSNGTRAGTHLLMDIRPGSRSSVIRYLFSDGHHASFTANDGTGRAFWVTDGTVAGTHRQQP